MLKEKYKLGEDKEVDIPAPKRPLVGQELHRIYSYYCHEISFIINNQIHYSPVGVFWAFSS
jgi:hypothetical protein